MSAELIFEIGCEELPASFIVPALQVLADGWKAEAARLRLAHGEVRTCGTPRRLALLVKGVAIRAEDVEERGEGPALSSAFDADGRPTKAAEGLARKWSLTVDQLGQENGRLVAVRQVAGRPALELLPDLLSGLVAETARNRKTMRWGHGTAGYPRPVRWLCALFGGEVVRAKFANVTAGGVSYGHRFLAPGEVRLDSVDGYVDRLREAKVLADVAERRARVVAEIDRVAAEAGGRRVVDDELVDTITGLVEWPSGVLGSFEADALEMPREVLISEMRGHQKYASLEGHDGVLRPQFVAVANTPVKDVAVSRRGYERVLRARLADARYFFDEDRTRTLDSRVADLARVTFQEKLGSIHDKVERIGTLAQHIAREAGFTALHLVERAARLCKADLTCGMVGEFPELQGVMGREYARHDGESAEVATALFDHYLPRGASDMLPEGDIGAFVGLADRLDTVTGIFGIGKAPTGANDPFALRRACLGVVRIVLHKGWRLSLGAMVDAALASHYARFETLPKPAPVKGKDGKERPEKAEYLDRAEARAQVLEFFRARLKALWSDEYGADVVEAVLSVGFDDLTDAYRRLTALSALRGQADFVPLAVAFGRASNIVEKQGQELVPGPVDGRLFQDDAELRLHQATQSAATLVAQALRSGDYATALRAIGELRPAVDDFFEKVMVMAPEAELRQNRLRLVREVQQLFAPIADFARIQTK